MKASDFSKEQPNKLGRPSSYTQEKADRICAEIIEGKSLRTICIPDEMPSLQTIFSWFRAHPDFLEQYTRAKQEQADAMSEEMLDIADDGTNDWMEVRNKDGECVAYQINGEHVQRSRLRIETRKWLASKLKPKKYGDKVGMEVTGKDGGPVEQVATVKVIIGESAAD